MNSISLGYDSVEFPVDCSYIKIIDQTKLPIIEEFIYISCYEGLADAINSLKVRGAPALGVITAAGIAMLFRSCTMNSFSEALLFLKKISHSLVSLRPTAFNTKWAAERMLSCFISEFNPDYFNLEKSKVRLSEEANIIKEEDIGMSLKIAKNGLSLLKPGDKLLTICNAGHLATARYGTALAPIYMGNEMGYSFSVYVTETRPLLQGSRLTAFELSKSNIDVTLICDNMVATLLKNGEINAILSGCDRIALNGDTANKIGTNSLAVLANFYKVPFYVLGPRSTIDNKTENGNLIQIENRDGREITDLWYKERMAPKNIKVYNPAFDVTDSALISAIITDIAIYRYPYDFSVED